MAAPGQAHRGRPPTQSGSRARNPIWLNAWITPRTGVLVRGDLPRRRGRRGQRPGTRHRQGALMRRRDRDPAAEGAREATASLDGSELAHNAIAILRQVETAISVYRSTPCNGARRWLWRRGEPMRTALACCRLAQPSMPEHGRWRSLAPMSARADGSPVCRVGGSASRAGRDGAVAADSHRPGRRAGRARNPGTSSVPPGNGEARRGRVRVHGEVGPERRPPGRFDPLPGEPEDLGDGRP